MAGTNNANVARWRADPANRERENAKSAAYNRALVQLKKRYPADFDRYYRKQLKAAGVTLRKAGRPRADGTVAR